MPLLGAAAWLGAVGGTLARGPVLVLLLVAVGLTGCGVAAACRHRPGVVRSVGALVLVALAAGSIAALRAERVAHNPVSALADEGAAVTVVGTVTSDPHSVAGSSGSFAGDQVVWRLAAHRVTGRGRTVELVAPVLVLGGSDDAEVPLGATVRMHGRLVPADDRDLAALLRPSGAVEVVEPPGLWWRTAAAVRQALRDSVAHRPADQRALVPALVDGDDARVDPALQDAFRTTGLTHLLAVSGTNLTLVVGFLLWLARWFRVRGRWLHLVAATGIAGFVLIARAEPSVLRAAVMGSIGLVALGTDGRHRALPGLAGAVLVLVLVDPGLGVSAGFALSALATGGILLLAPAWRDALARWLPRWLAEAVAVPAAAQLACTPLIAVVSGQVSLIAVLANLLAAPAVGPATVLGLVGGLVTLVVPSVGRLVGAGAGWCVAWIIEVSRHTAALPTPAIGWGSGPVAIASLVVVSAGAAVLGPRLIRRRTTGLACCGVLVAAVLVRVPTPGWPPDDWLMVVCDVGQGDGLVLATGSPHIAVVVDAGPDPRSMDDCLSDLGISRVPLVVLTHFHADHVDGLSGVLDGREVDGLEVSRLADPPAGVAEVRDDAGEAGLTPHVAPYATSRRIGDLTLEAVWPLPGSPTGGPGDGSTANNASVVLLARISDATFFLGGDVEPEGQAPLAAMLPGLHVDVLKVPHHGSRYQDVAFLQSLGAGLALISVGADNDYGHPAAATVAALESTGARVLRTDRDGSIAVVEHGGRLATVTTPR